MRNSILLLLVFSINKVVWSQIKLKNTLSSNDKTGFYLNLEYGNSANLGSLSSINMSNNASSTIEKLMPLDMRGSSFALTGGLQIKKHRFELGYGQLSHHSGGKYVMPAAPEKLLNAFSTVRTMNYVPLRYYYRIATIFPRLSVDVGTGLGIAFFPDAGKDFVSDPIERNYVEYYPNGQPFSIKELTDEEQLRRTAATAELTTRLNWQIGSRLGFNFLYRFIYAPTVIRKTDFNISPQVGTPQIGTINSSLTSSQASLGVHYYFSPVQIEKRIQKEGQKRFYVGTDVGLFYNSGTFKGTVSSGVLEKSDLPTITKPQLSLQIGYSLPNYTVELSYQKLYNFNNYTYDRWRFNPESTSLVLSRDDTGVSSDYFALRLYRNLIKEPNKWQFLIGGGLAYAQFKKEDIFSDFQLKTTSTQTLQNEKDPSVNVMIDYSDYEKVKQKTICLEGNLKAERNLNENWRIVFWSRYIYNPETVRTVRFTVENNKSPKRTGETRTSLTSFGLGMGLQYHF